MKVTGVYRQFLDLVASEFGQTVSVPSAPSDVTLAIWRSVADTYDPLALRPLWRYTTLALKNRPEIEDAVLFEAVAFALALTQQFSDLEVSPELEDYFELEGQDVAWDDIQDAVENLSNCWRCLGL